MKTGRIKYLAFCLAMVLLSTAGIAQEQSKEERRAQLESKKVAYCTDRAGLTPEESAQFWALRNEVNEKKKAIMKEAPRRRDIDPETATDKEIRDAIKKKLEQHIKAEQLEYEYLDKFMDIVGPKKFALMKKAEKEFKTEVLRKLKGERRGLERGEERGPRGPRGPENER